MRTMTRVVVVDNDATYSNDSELTAKVNGKGTVYITGISKPKLGLRVEFLKAKDVIEECGTCGHLHVKGEGGDCRNDDGRFVTAE